MGRQVLADGGRVVSRAASTEGLQEHCGSQGPRLAFDEEPVAPSRALVRTQRGDDSDGHGAVRAGEDPRAARRAPGIRPGDIAIGFRPAASGRGDGDLGGRTIDPLPGQAGPLAPTIGLVLRNGTPAQRVSRQLDAGISQIDARRPATTRGQDGRHRHRPSLGGPPSQHDVQPIRGRRHHSAQHQRRVSAQARTEEHDVDLPAGQCLTPPAPVRRRGDLEQPPLTARLQTPPGLRRRQTPPAGTGRLRQPCPYLSPGHTRHHPEPGGAARFDL